MNKKIKKNILDNETWNELSTNYAHDIFFGQIERIAGFAGRITDAEIEEYYSDIEYYDDDFIPDFTDDDFLVLEDDDQKEHVF